ncbi:MAG: glycosyltransferase [Coriobacteriales bacterium]|nr:glycosyltransferase [Coriobacteriales bacterium]
MSEFLVFLMLWGVWLITPVFVDGIDSIGRLFVVKRDRSRRKGEDPIADEDLPMMSIIVPAHNEAAVIDRCLASVKAQRYPHEKLEVIVIDDGSTDGTADLAEAHASGEVDVRDLVIRGERITVGPFEGRFIVIRNGHAGKAHALNTGITASTGDIVVNIDSDVVLAPDAVRGIAEAFVRCPDMGAATGNIEIDWELVEERDSGGELVVDDEGLPVSKRLSHGERFLSHSQFLEYLGSFRLGRHAQAALDSMFTLAGACSAFRRSEVQTFFEYSNRTVSEDTDLTWQLHRRGVRVGFIPRARVLLEPTTDWDSLYAQRVRWARGQLEVCALSSDEKRKDGKKSGGNTLAKTLLYDHTLAFPRLVWAPLMLFFPLLGYSPKLLMIVFAAMYAFYVIIETINVFAVFQIAEEDTKARIERCGWAVLALPAYRFVVFYFRFAGFLIALREEQQWTTPGVTGGLRERLDVARLRSVRLAAATGRAMMLAWNWMFSAGLLVLVPLMTAGVALAHRLLAAGRRDG